MACRGIEPVIPARPTDQRATHQEERKLRQLGGRWIVEQTFARLGHYRHFVVRYEGVSTA